MYRLVNGKKEFIDISYKYNKNENIYFICEKCNNEKHIQYRSWKKINICSNCRRKHSLNKTIKQHKDQIVEKREQTNLDKYGSKYPYSFGSNNYNKIIQKKYHVENISQLDKIKEKKKQTMTQNYGTCKSFLLPQTKETIIKKYGVDNVSKNVDIKRKISISNKKKSKQAFEKRKQTNLKLYGVENIMDCNKYYTYDNLFNSIKFQDVEPLFSRSEYIDSKTKYKWKCRKCNTEFNDNLLSGKIPRCSICFPYYKSIGEQEIVNYIKSLNIDIQENIKSIITPYELDIYIPDYNLAIEFDGIYYHTEKFGKDKKYHLNKTIECEKQNIQLLHIFEDEWLNKKEIVKNIIKIKLGIINKKVFGRKCIIKELESKNIRNFLNLYHIQGYIPAKVNLGLYYQDELISLLTFGKSRFNKKYEWEILRFVNKQGYSIIGGFSKMLKHFISNYNGSIITYSDRRLFDGGIYENNGFIKQKSSPPNYYYFKNGQRYGRQRFMKHKLEKQLDIFDANLTEWENMELNKYDRIWDCGNNVYIKDIT